jgi:hypothetical protein
MVTNDPARSKQASEKLQTTENLAAKNGHLIKDNSQINVNNFPSSLQDKNIIGMPIT